MLREMADLGYEYVELSHGIRITLVPGILKAVEEGVVKISSTHNFCPLPTGVVQAAPNLFEPSVTEHREHDQWLRHTKRSIDFAAQVKARVLVCHLGSVTFLVRSGSEHPQLSARSSRRGPGRRRFDLSGAFGEIRHEVAQTDGAVLGANQGQFQ